MSFKKITLSLVFIFSLIGFLVYKLFSLPVYQPLLANFNQLKSTDNRVNILVLGAGGDNHTAGDLTDTIILLSVDLKDYDVATISLPRDLWIDDMKAKINTAYHYGEEREPGGGLDLAKSVVETAIDQPIHYAIYLDFSSFIESVDVLGGLTVDVERAFDDYRFPIPGRENDLCQGDPEYNCRYEHIHFDAGLQLMDGATALKFIRSRHAEGDEGTDFARSARQQKVITALRNEIFSPRFLLSSKPEKMYEIFKTSIKSNISQNEIWNLVWLAFYARHSQIRSTVLTNGENGLFYTPSVADYGQWILLPKNDWQEVQQYINRFIIRYNW